MSQLARIAAVVVAFAGTAHAHFILDAPASYDQLDTSGMPQKSAPCGQNDAGYPVVATNAVTTVESSSQLTITIDEAIFHPGHYRVALASDMSGLPADPMVMPNAQSQCGTAMIQTTPMMPIIADDMLDHTTPFNGSQSFKVSIPAMSDLPCTSCTLQVIEFMSDHGSPCFYHHCASLKIVPPGQGPDAGTGGGDQHHGGCSSSGGGGGIVLALAFVVLACRRRR
jgi:uncharacterized protein (TIGR03382 family)